MWNPGHNLSCKWYLAANHQASTEMSAMYPGSTFSSTLPATENEAVATDTFNIREKCKGEVAGTYSHIVLIK